MGGAGSQGSHGGEAGDLDGNEGVDGRVVAQLAHVVGSPGPDGAVGAQGVGLVGPGRHGDHVRQAWDLDGHQRGGCRVVAELAEVVVAPGPHRAVGPHRQGVVPAGGDGAGGRGGIGTCQAVGLVVAELGPRARRGSGRGAVAPGVVGHGHRPRGPHEVGRLVGGVIAHRRPRGEAGEVVGGVVAVGGRSHRAELGQGGVAVGLGLAHARGGDRRHQIGVGPPVVEAGEVGATPGVGDRHQAVGGVEAVGGGGAVGVGLGHDVGVGVGDEGGRALGPVRDAAQPAGVVVGAPHRARPARVGDGGDVAGEVVVVAHALVGPTRRRRQPPQGVPCPLGGPRAVHVLGRSRR